MTDLYLVGGFLGAGKTTLLGAAATRLRGATVGLISNDQAAGLVDTQLFEAAAGTVREVSGSCFCCNFPGFLAAARSLRDAGCDVVLAEPVGSCTDLSATLAQPLKDRHAAEFRLCGLTALADPCRLAAILDGGMSGLHQSAAYIVKKQLEEADIILINKVDLLDAAARDRLAARTAARFPGAQVLCASARTGEGVDRWLATAGAMDGAGRRVVSVDYDTYAEGEAALGWLNLTASLTVLGAADWNDLARRLIDDLAARFRALSAPVGHVKLLANSSAGYAVANLTGGEPSVRGDAGATDAAMLTVNARVELPPEQLRAEVLAALRRACGAAIEHRVDALVSLTPGRPNPTYRYDRAIG